MHPHLYKRPCPSVRRLVGWSVGWSVMLSSNWAKNGILRILNDLHTAGLGGRRDEEEGVTRRKEGRGGRRDGEECRGGRKDGKEGGTTKMTKNDK